MVSVLFLQPSQEGLQPLGRLVVTNGYQPQIQGQLEWLDFEFAPISSRLGRVVAYGEDPEEWARSLAEAYPSGGQVEVRLEADDLAAAMAPTQAASIGKEAVVYEMQFQEQVTPQPAPQQVVSSEPTSAEELMDTYNMSPYEAFRAIDLMEESGKTPKRRLPIRPKVLLLLLVLLGGGGFLYHRQAEQKADSSNPAVVSEPAAGAKNSKKEAAKKSKKADKGGPAVALEKAQQAAQQSSAK